jgi:hypothetical protein
MQSTKSGAARSEYKALGVEPPDSATVNRPELALALAKATNRSAAF